MNQLSPAKAPGARPSRLAATALACALALSGCALPDKPVRPTVYDFGPGATAPARTATVTLPAVALAPVESSSALDSAAVLYRLGYADAQQLRPYAQARWSMPPAELLHQRLRERLATQRMVLTPAQAGTPRADGPAAPWQLRMELEEFSQLFTSAQQSQGLLRLRATVTQTTTQGQVLRQQRSFSVQRPAAQPDAAGGVRALTEASDAVIDELLAWLATLSQ